MSKQTKTIVRGDIQQFLPPWPQASYYEFFERAVFPFVTFSADLKYFICGTGFGILHCFGRLSSQRQRQIVLRDCAVLNVQFNPTISNLIAITCWDKPTLLWYLDHDTHENENNNHDDDTNNKNININTSCQVELPTSSATSWSPNGDILAKSHHDQFIHFYNVIYHQNVLALKIPIHNYAIQLLFSPCGNRFAAVLCPLGLTTKIVLWNDLNQYYLNKTNNNENESNNKDMLSSSPSFSVQQQEQQPIEGLLIPGNVSRVCNIAFSPCGNFLTYVSTSGHDVCLMDVNKIQTVGIFTTSQQQTAEIQQICFDPNDSKKIITGDKNGIIRSWHISSTRTTSNNNSMHNDYDDTTLLFNANVVVSLRGHKSKNKIVSMSFSPNGRTLASYGKDNRIRLWEYPFTGRTIQQFKTSRWYRMK